MKWEKCVLSISEILENPDVERGYEDLKKYYDSNNLKYEKDCIDYLIYQKFKNANRSNTSQKQSKHD